MENIPIMQKIYPKINIDNLFGTTLVFEPEKNKSVVRYVFRFYPGATSGSWRYDIAFNPIITRIRLEADGEIIIDGDTVLLNELEYYRKKQYFYSIGAYSIGEESYFLTTCDFNYKTGEYYLETALPLYKYDNVEIKLDIGPLSNYAPNSNGSAIEVYEESIPKEYYEKIYKHRPFPHKYRITQINKNVYIDQYNSTEYTFSDILSKSLYKSILINVLDPTSGPQYFDTLFSNIIININDKYDIVNTNWENMKYNIMEYFGVSPSQGMGMIIFDSGKNKLLDLRNMKIHFSIIKMNPDHYAYGLKTIKFLRMFYADK